MSRRNAEYISEDTVECFFFPTTDVNNLQILCESVNKTVQDLSSGYIWHRDELKVHIPISNKEYNDQPPHLTSVTCFGDNIEDEWFIVYLLLEITKQHQNIVVQVIDNDGEFLLIESADFLPSWANPETTENRVFIYQNHIHLIPPSVIDSNTALNITEAINMMLKVPQHTKSLEIQQVILKRIGNYPAKINENLHNAVVTLPIDIAALLTLKPTLISPIVSAYCNHDILDAKACKSIKFDNCVTTTIKFTKCLYAMLIHSKLMKNVKTMKINENDKKSMIGVKLTCAYEMIMSKLSGDIFSSKEFQKFVKSLSKNGYFKDNIEGSKDYKQLLERAKEFFLNMECPINTQTSNYITHLMQTAEFNSLKEMLKIKPAEELTEDNDDWLNIHPEQLNDLLNSRYGKQSKFKSGDVLNSQTLTTELSNFLKQTSDFEGIETDIKQGPENGPIEFDSEEFINSLKNMMNFVASGNDADIYVDSDFSDDMDDFTIPEGDLDKELKAKLFTNDKAGPQDSKTILLNMIKSVKEEEGSSGPSSNILKTIGINKTDLLDSDDDQD
ncbi:protein ecdysoneless [Pectinophora gossypiella]|uniref:protein ecdysoneless n=1 Tax=Pectinophora gossypiella TaxID=13191 RepID=UPI00214EE247|nr:protein ecdysoneless [Pectinophora gossypiella]